MKSDTANPLDRSPVHLLHRASQAVQVVFTMGMQTNDILQRRRTKEDARAYAVKLTAEGQQVLRAAEPLAKRVDERILDALPAKHRAAFMGALASIVSTLERAEPTTA